MTKKEKRFKIYKYLLFHCCQKCGENDVVCLDFHHVDPSTKLEAISVLLRENKEWHVIENEIKKCQVLCANCHRKITAFDNNWFKNDDDDFYENNVYEDFSDYNSE